MYRFIQVSLFLFLGTVLQAQGPWIPQQGVSYVQAVFSTVPGYEDVYVEDDTESIDRAISDNTIALYGEFGISDKIGLSVNAPLVFQNSGDAVGNAVPLRPSGDLAGLGNISLAGKFLLYQKKFVASIIGQVDIPTSTVDADLGLATGVDDCN